MRVMLLAFAALAAGCSFRVRKEHLQEADVGPKPKLERAVQLAGAAFANAVDGWDLERAVFGSELTPGYYRLDNRDTRFAWMLRASAAPLNDMGQRAAPRIYHAYFLDDEIVAISVPTYEWNGRQYHELYAATEFNGGGRTIKAAGLSPQAKEDF